MRRHHGTADGAGRLLCGTFHHLERTVTDPMPDYEKHDATALAALVATGEVTASDLIDAAVHRIDARDPILNALVAQRIDAARAEVAANPPTGPFAGVPFLIKDLTSEIGEPTTYGSVFFRDFIGEITPELVHRFRRTGLVSLGRTNTPEFGLLPTTEPVLHGPTRNPWNLAHSSGGSSGGAAAAVAAGLVPMAHASDGGGSIRIPASACGLFGLKPARGRIPARPAASSDYLSVGLVVSRSVRDTAGMLDAMSGAVPGSRYDVPHPERPFREEAATDPRHLRIAVTYDDLNGEPIHPDCVKALVETVSLLESLGHEVVETRPQIDGPAVAEAFLVWWKAMQQASFLLVLDAVQQRRGGATLRRMLGDSRTMKAVAKLRGGGGFEPFTWKLYDEARQLGPGDLLLATATLQDASYQLGAFLTGYDLWLTPTLGEPPRQLGSFDQTLDFDEFEADLARYVPYTPVANFSGFPAMSVPLYWNDAGLPIGSHFIGRAADEATLLRLAGQLERSAPWFDRRPPEPTESGLAAAVASAEIAAIAQAGAATDEDQPPG